MMICILILLSLDYSQGQVAGDVQKWTYKIGYGPPTSDGIYGTVRYFTFHERLFDLKDLVSDIVAGESHPCYADTGCETENGLGYRVKYKYAIKAFFQSYYYQISRGEEMSETLAVTSVAVSWCCNKDGAYVENRNSNLSPADWKEHIDLDICKYERRYNERRAIDVIMDKKSPVTGKFQQVRLEIYVNTFEDGHIIADLNFKDDFTLDICDMQGRPPKPPPTPPPGSNTTFPPTTVRPRGTRVTYRPGVGGIQGKGVKDAMETKAGVTKYLLPALVIICILIVIAVVVFKIIGGKKKKKLRRKKRKVRRRTKKGLRDRDRRGNRRHQRRK